MFFRQKSVLAIEQKQPGMKKKTPWDSGTMCGQKGRIVVVTGAAGGLGYEISRVFAEKGARVVMAVRNPQKGVQMAAMIRDMHESSDVEVMALNLADLSSVRAFSDTFHKQYSRLDILVNNAGVMACPYGKTADGFELQFGTNHLGHFALTLLLVDLIRRVPGGRVVTVSSLAHSFGSLDFDDLNWQKRRYSKWQAYGDSKLANLYFMQELQRRFEGKQLPLLAAAAHPGCAATDLQRHEGWLLPLNVIFAQSAAMGALPVLYAASASDVKGGGFYGPDGMWGMRGYPAKAQPNIRSKDMRAAELLWDVSEEFTGIQWQNLGG